MPFFIDMSDKAKSDFAKIENNPAFAKRFKAVRKALGLLENNPRHPGLNIHKYDTLHGENGQEVFEAYAENNTPGAYRIFWHYGPDKNVITILAITAHP